MTDILHIHGRDQKGRPSYTKETLGEPVVELTEGEVQTMEQWANERKAPYTAPDKDAS